MQNFESEPSQDFQMSVKHATAEVRRGFIRKVYGILSAQLLLTAIIAAPIASQPPVWAASHIGLFQMASVMTIAIMCAMSCYRETARKFPTNYIFLFTFTVFEAVVVGFFSSQYTPQSVLLSAVVTMLIFAGMTVYAWRTTSDFTGMGPYIFAAMLVFCMMGFAVSIMAMCGVNVDMAIIAMDALGVLLFTFYIVYDTQLIIGEYHGHQNQFSVDDYVFAALTLYVDIVQLFLYILRMLGKRD